MNDTELRAKAGAILREEEREVVDWDLVQRLSDALDEELTAKSYVGCPDIVRHFLCDDDIRARDEIYAEGQREAVRRYVETGEYHDSKAVPWWACLLVLTALVVLLVWLV